MIKPIATAVAAVLLAGITVVPATAAPAAAPAAASTVATTAVTKNKTVKDVEVLRKETANGVTYTATGTHEFRIRITPKGSVKYRGGYSAAITSVASPAANSELTLVKTETGKPKVRLAKGVKVKVKTKKGFKTVRVDGIHVTNTFTGWAKTESGALYRQTATLRTTVTKYGQTSKVVLGPEVLVSAATK